MNEETPYQLMAVLLISTFLTWKTRALLNTEWAYIPEFFISIMTVMMVMLTYMTIVYIIGFIARLITGQK